MERMASAARDTFGRIDLLVNAAGVLRSPGEPLQKVAQLSAAAWDDVLDTNLKGTFLSNRAVLPVMLQQRKGDIINISSIAGRLAIPFDAGYAASKWGVIGLTEALADEVRRHGVRVQVLLPGKSFGGTRMGDGAGTANTGFLPPADRVADVIVFLATLPPDTRLIAPIVEPLVSEFKFNKGIGSAPATQARSASEGEAMTEQVQTSQPGRLAGKVVLVTGGAGGIGLAACRAIAGEGASVVLIDVQPERVETAVRDLGAAFPVLAGHLGFSMDVRKEEDHQRLIQTVQERFGRIDALIACAGILRKRGTPPKPVAETATDEWDEVLDVNLRGVFLSNRAVLPIMIRQHSGAIINISSVSGLEGRALDGPYCASKFGVIGLTQSIAEEVRHQGIKVSVILPDAVATGLWEQNHPLPAPTAILAPERVAELIVFMLTQPADTILVKPVIAPLGARRRKGAGRQAPAAE
jgi:NAD(P)-dependent dehydrogenase (short-subunit alcohol dehydrogenase family)